MDDKIKKGLQEIGRVGRRLKTSGSRKGHEAGFCEYGTETSGFIKFEKFLH